MPTYEYACEACENTWEFEQRITEAPLRDCPKCGAPKARRLISGSRFVLKGGGWYADGYGSKKPSASEDSASKRADAKPDAKSETKSETKSEAKSETKSEAKSETKSEAKSETKGGSGSTPANSAAE